MNGRSDEPNRSRGSKRLERMQKSWRNCPRVIDESNTSQRGRNLQEHLQPLTDDRGFESLKAGNIAPGSREAPDEAAAYGIEDIRENDRNGARFPKECRHSWSGARDNEHFSPTSSFAEAWMRSS